MSLLEVIIGAFLTVAALGAIGAIGGMILGMVTVLIYWAYRVVKFRDTDVRSVTDMMVFGVASVLVLMSLGAMLSYAKTVPMDIPYAERLTSFHISFSIAAAGMGVFCLLVVANAWWIAGVSEKMKTVLAIFRR